MIKHAALTNRQVRQMIHTGKIVMGGNSRLNIYGTLTCKSGKRMKRDNRVFFASKEDAIENGYRPCGHCLHQEYLLWRKSKR